MERNTILLARLAFFPTFLELPMYPDKHPSPHTHTHAGYYSKKSSSDVPLDTDAAAAALAIKLAFQVTELSNLLKAGWTPAVTDAVACRCTHTCAVCCGWRWIGVQIVSDMLISSPSLTAEAWAPAVKERHAEPSRISSSSVLSSLIPFSLLFFLSWSIPSLFRIKEMFHLSFCHLAANYLMF